MSCNHCDKNDSFMMIDETIDTSVFIMGEKSNFTGKEVLSYEESIYVFIDRGYLRLVGDDNGCLDHGEKIKINFCPVCGEWLTNPDKEAQND